MVKKEETEQYQTTNENSAPAPKRLYRSERNRVLGGVAGGFGDYFNVDPTLIRILFIFMTIFGGSGLLLYLILWLIIPSQNSATHISQETIRENVGDMKARAKFLTQDLRFKKQEDDSKFVWGAFILILGLLFLFHNFGFLRFIDIGKLWPLILIFLGISILLRK